MHNQALVINNQAGATMSSLEIATVTGKRHTHVIRDIRAMLDELAADEPVMGHQESLDARGYTAEFRLSRELTEILITGYSIPLRAKVIRRLHELEATQKTSVPSSFAEALRLAADQQEQIQQLQITNQHISMKIDVLEQLLAAGVSAPEFCRRLNGVNTMMVNGFLRDAGWLLESGSAKARWRVASAARDKYMTEKAFELTPAVADSFTVTHCVLLKAGAKKLVALYMAGKLPMKKTWDGDLKHDLAGVLGVVV